MHRTINKFQQRNIVIAFLLLTLCTAKVYSQKTGQIIDTIIINNMVQGKLDIESFEKNQKTNRWRYVKEDGTCMHTFKSGYGYYVEEEIPPNPKLYTIYREYYLNGNIKKAGLRLRRVPISIQKDYDEQGNVTSKNWDEHYGKFDYNQVILFLDKKGHVDIDTGKGREDLGLAYLDKEKCWEIHILPSDINQRLGYYYKLDGNSGKIKKTYRINPGS